MKKQHELDPATAPGHTDMMLSPEEIERCLDPKRIAQCLRDLADHLDDVPAEYPVAELRIAADIVEGII